jgi:hypothetical protein
MRYADERGVFVQKNGHPAMAWKVCRSASCALMGTDTMQDYYLDHAPRLEALIHGGESRKRAAASEDVGTPAASASASASASTRPRKIAQSAIAKLTHRVQSGVRLEPGPPRRHDNIPSTPNREPTPPSLVIAGNRGNKFTESDKEYFVKYLLWALKSDPAMSRADLCNRLSAKVGAAVSACGHAR